MRYLIHFFVLSFVPILMFVGSVSAQTKIPFGSLNHNASLPVEIVSDSFEVSQKNGTAVFEGNVVVGQGEMRLAAGKVEVNYSGAEGDTSGRIETLKATGGVTLANGLEAAEAREALYSIDKGTIVMKGSVIMTQGDNAMSGEFMTIDLESGSAVIEGRVKTIFQSGSDN